MNRFNLTYYQATLNATLSGTLWSFTFTGKEKDAETGYGYFGARYMDHDLMTMWMSVDPMADKYPGMSPYSYCANNPVKLVDPDGREIDVSGMFDQNGGAKKGYELACKAFLFLQRLVMARRLFLDLQKKVRPLRVILILKMVNITIEVSISILKLAN